MDIYEELKKLSYKKQTYFRWRHDLEYDKRKEKHSEQELCRILGVKTLNEYIKWEQSAQYRELVNLVLETKFANDLEEVYKVTSEKARQGDEKAIKLLLDLQKRISEVNKANRSKQNNKSDEQESAFNDLEL
ncbi:phBC6A51 family helix-turn-helix protein [Lederbergia sp. NSJ-179]|uniref:phBC6A51 family helix-turn-helix protein n=1 Tax=Lederbergia sp. NSJ-179 TaxID=2931402 RepID=UPI001FD323E9|nr:phBC6A51 family helix-turn-helix protein [Lederbergia sp. NSJ-179]MCJ7841765.1 phBC6A51 family helix-turn-helix protein [Lederbergia sp. NSJ-179]